MTSKLQELFLKQIDDVIAHQNVMKETAKYKDLSSMPPWEYEKMITMALAAIDRIAGPDSVYAEQARQANTEDNKKRYKYFRCFKKVISILESLRAAVASGYLQSTRELIHGSLFADFLEMASHLLDEDYKDPAAVLAGSTLESHLRQLCGKSGVEIVLPDGNPKKADRMNADLAKKKVYSVLDQKNVTAWLDLRNKAAHGQYDKYTQDQVGLLIAGVRDFLTRNPA